MKTYLVVAYDITSDRKRARLSKKLENFLPRIQKSVFEGWVPNRRLQALERLLEEGIDLETDMVRIYTLCGRCRTLIRGLGCCSEGPAGAEVPDEIIDN